MRFNVGVHPTRVGLEVGAILRRGDLKRLLGGDSESQNSLLAVVLEKGIAQNLGNFAGGEAPHHVHLPQTVLRGHVPLGKKKIVEICRFNRGYAVSVAHDRHPGGEAGHFDVSVQLGQGRARDGVEPGQRSQRNEQYGDQKDGKNSPHREAGARGNRSGHRGHAMSSATKSGFLRTTDSMVGSPLKQMRHPAGIIRAKTAPRTHHGLRSQLHSDQHVLRHLRSSRSCAVRSDCA